VATDFKTGNRKRNLDSIGMEKYGHRVFGGWSREDLGKDWLSRTAGKMGNHVPGRETGNMSERSG
jgi:hypothetical protein